MLKKWTAAAISCGLALAGAGAHDAAASSVRLSAMLSGVPTYTVVSDHSHSACATMHGLPVPDLHSDELGEKGEERAIVPTGKQDCLFIAC